MTALLWSTTTPVRGIRVNSRTFGKARERRELVFGWMDPTVQMGRRYDPIRFVQNDYSLTIVSRNAVGTLCDVSKCKSHQSILNQLHTEEYFPIKGRHFASFRQKFPPNTMKMRNYQHSVRFPILRRFARSQHPAIFKSFGRKLGPTN